MESIYYSPRLNNPQDKASGLSSVLFWWTYNVLKKGRKNPYEIEDLPNAPQCDNAHVLGNKLDCIWSAEIRAGKDNKKPSLLRALIKMFWKEFIWISILHSINDFIICISKQIFIGLFLIYLKKSKTDSSCLISLRFLGVCLVFCFAMNSLLHNHFLSKSYHLGNRMKVALTSLIYRKCLRLNHNLHENASPGRIVNLISNDLRLFDDIILYCNYIWSGLISSAIILVIIGNIIGILPVMICVVGIICAVVIQLCITKSLARVRIKMAYASDARIQLLDEILGGIQIIKLYVWEESFEKLIKVLRRIEMKLIKKNMYLRSLRSAVNVFLSKFSLYILIMVYSLMGGDVLPEKIFLIMGYCLIISKILCGMSFRSYGQFAQCYISIKRLQAFLELKDFEKPLSSNISTSKAAVMLSNVSASWSVNSTIYTLRNISLNVNIGSLTTVIGEVGSGKSSLLSIILGELSVQEGKLLVNGVISYYSQSTWVFPGTIRQNIIFTENFEKNRYERVTEICALTEDLKLFPSGDQTLIGEKGVTLSGGQKARIALARTIYKRADIYLLDDPLSAVDSNVGKFIFTNCILGFLEEKTRIVVTHQLQFLRDSSTIILLEKGKITAEGSLLEIMNTNAKYINTLKSLNLQNEEKKIKKKVFQKHSNYTEEAENVESVNEDFTQKELEKEDNPTVKMLSFFQYLLLGAGFNGIFLTSCLCIVTQLIFVFIDIWITSWTAFTERMQKDNTSRKENWIIFSSVTRTPTEFYVMVYSVLIVSVFIIVLFRNLCFAYYGEKCAETIHMRAFHGVVNTYFSFFHKNPSGRILNRFSKDIGVVDDPMVTCLLDAITLSLQVIAAFILSSAVNPGFVPLVLLVLITLCSIQKFYLQTSRNLKQLENIAKSPVFVHLRSSLHGLSTIHASEASSKLIEEFDQCQDVHTSAWFLYNFTGFGYAYALEIIGVSYMALIVTGTFFLDLTQSQVGLSLAQIVNLLNYIQWTMKQIAELLNYGVSVDRLLKYSALPAEMQLQEKVCDDLVDDWPSEGRIHFENVSFKYNLTSLPIINKVSFTIQPQEKVGIVGRTGAGKTSLLAAIFRLGFVEGSIKIDGVDIKTVKLKKLRSKVSVIPQDPVFFSSTIRRNLDPTNEYNDTVLWNALEEAEMKSNLTQKGGMGLDTLVEQCGKNFSVGQKQLICLARAIVRNNKILILDEVTANIDQKTDSIIQKTIKHKFRTCTILTIAHRLNTIIDSDKILVMHNGEVVEFDHPQKLLQQKDGYLYRLLAENEDLVGANRKEIANENYNESYGGQLSE